MGVIAEAVRHMLAAGMDAAAVADAVAAMEAAMPMEGMTVGKADAAERKREADRERQRRKRATAKEENGRADDSQKSQVSHEVAECRATSATSRDGGDPSPEEKRKVSPCTPSKEKNPTLSQFHPVGS